jgi:pimeloyl-ACP methyl ester carboxylesterase
MSAVTIGGDLVHYEVLGRGRPAILLHSWVGSWRYWIPAMQQLQLKYRVYVLDLYGFGDTGKNPQKYKLDFQVQLIVDFMNHMAMPKAAFIGHGLGALVTAEFARLYPDKAPRIMLVSAPLFDPGNLDKRVPPGQTLPLTHNRALTPDPVQMPADEATIMNASERMRAALLERARTREHGETPKPLELPVIPTDEKGNRHNPLQALFANTKPDGLLAKCFKRSEPEFDKLMVDINKTDPAAIRDSVSTFDSGRMLDTVRLLKMPTVLLHGLADDFIGAPGDSIWQYVTTQYPDTTLAIPLQNVRHFPMLEYERFNRLANDFLEIADINQLEIKERWQRRIR